jgi:ABC-type multidrug transport system fused ATPase/permease subunit
MGESIMYLAAFVTLVAVAVATAVIAVRREGRDTGDLIKRLIIWFGIAALLPLLSWAGATMIHPRTRLKEMMSQEERVALDTNDTNTDVEARTKARDEQQRLKKLIGDEDRLFYRAMFWIGYPIGMTALVVGLLLRSVAVGTGLAFGGLCALSAGCYSYWDDMGDALRFFSLLIVLAILVGIGLLKFGKPAAA